ncbi:MAG: M61 family metallopeptidase [Thiomonas sp.]
MPQTAKILASRPRSAVARATANAAAEGPHYSVRMDDMRAHLFAVELRLATPDPQGQEFWLPVWIPGSYLVREFARHVLRVEARCQGKPVALRKVAKNRWRAAPCRGPLQLSWTVYARDASVRTAWLDATRAFFNPSSLLLAAAGWEAKPHALHILPPASQPDWSVATTLPAAQVDARGFGLYQASDYDRLIDHPVEMGRLLRLQFRAHGTPHEMVIAHADRLRGEVDTKRLRADLKSICETEIALFEPERPRAPFKRYAFLLAPTASGYGGLEHADCTALICAESDLPHPRDGAERSAGYRQFLGLCSHEYFHAWNVKRIRPQALTPYDLERENTTGLLWLFEGFTSYYDDLILRRAGLIEPQQYLDLLARAINAVQATPGRQVQSLADASFDAWIKFYRPDENTANATVSYYTLGGLFALALDLTLRSRSQTTLDDVMRLLWQRYGRDDASLHGQGVPEDALPALVREVSGLDLRGLFARHVHGRDELPLKRLLASVGVRWSQGKPDALSSLGLRLDDAQGWPQVRQVLAGGWAEQAGLAPGDILLAINGQRASPEQLKRLHARGRAGDAWQAHVMRDARLMQLQAMLPAPGPAPAPGPVALSVAPAAAAGAALRRKRWLGV